ncbi:hypothetical protein CSKR_110398 [Clonorchis sinensis]|uniref:Uncharacterized protein n=1 Tax=Clonorchis sinensis TaxID=79923 RepID=A0A3R7FTP5_CLOSI|nr:hypothetical protein CSKR_110398 [Clonorchis sinensis]
MITSKIPAHHTASTQQRSETAKPQKLRRELTSRKVLRINPTPAFSLLLSRLGRPDRIPALLLLFGGMVVRRRKGATVERFL